MGKKKRHPEIQRPFSSSLRSVSLTFTWLWTRLKAVPIYLSLEANQKLCHCFSWEEALKPNERLTFVYRACGGRVHICTCKCENRWILFLSRYTFLCFSFRLLFIPWHLVFNLLPSFQELWNLIKFLSLNVVVDTVSNCPFRCWCN